jgi:hypothetical protein
MEDNLTIPVNLEIEEIKNELRVVDDDEIQALIEVATPLISAKAVYKVSYIDQTLEDSIIIDGIHFSSRVLRKNLEGVKRVFPFILTLGKRLEENADACTDFLQKYYFDAIGNLALRKARKYLQDHLRSTFALNGLSFMSPGSLADWPIEEQKPLFSVLKGTEKSIDLTLTESLLMIPRKSVSGIYFPTEVTFHSCQLCPRQHCEGRKAPYDMKLAEEYEIS